MTTATETTSTKETEAPKKDGKKIFKNFRSDQTIEKFYRFINDNDLRNEASILVEHVLGKMKPQKKSRRSKKVH